MGRATNEKLSIREGSTGLGRAERGGMNRSPPYATTIPANGTSFQVLSTLATSDGSGSAQGTHRDAPPRATMNG